MIPIERELRDLGTPGRAAGTKAYLKSDLEFTGTTVPDTRSVIRSWCRARPGLTHDELAAAAGELWARPVFECRLAAVELLDAEARPAAGRRRRHDRADAAHGPHLGAG